MKGIILSLIIFLIALIIVGLFYFFWWRKRNMNNKQKKGIEGGGTREALTNNNDVEQKDESDISSNEKHEYSNMNSETNINDKKQNKRKVNDSVSDKNKPNESNENKTEQNKWNGFKESKQANINKIKNDVEISKPVDYLDFNELFVQPTTTDDSLYEIDTINEIMSKSNYDSLMNDVDCQNTNEIDVSKLNDLKDNDKRGFKNIESVLIEDAKKQTVFTLSGSNELF